MPTREPRTYKRNCTGIFCFWILILLAGSSYSQSVVPFKYTPVSPPAASYTFISNNLQAIFTDQSTGQIATWDWDFGDGNFSNLANPSHTYDSSGIYRVCLTITDTYGCQDSICDTLDIILKLSARQLMEDISLYPNPGSDISRLEFLLLSQAKVEVSLTSLLGKSFFRHEAVYPPGHRFIDLPLRKAGIPPGIYILNIKTPDFQRSLRLLVNNESR